MFGKVEYVEGVVDGEIAFITSAMTEAAFAEKINSIAYVSRIRLG